MSPVPLLALLIVAQPAPADPVEAKARAVLTSLTKGDFEGAGKDFTDEMRKALPAKKLAEVWKQLEGQVGAFESQGKATREAVAKFQVVWIPAKFQKLTLYCRVVLDGEGRVAGLNFRPSGPASEYKAPAYVQRDRFAEQEVTVGSGEWSLPGTISMPKGEGPFPGIVLVHGSGPHDRDETIGPNRPFRDLAWGLASQGVAVLRYEKRTKVHGARLAKLDRITVKEEVLDDAREAVALLRSSKGIDPARVYLLGHSLGGMAAPRLAEADPKLAGIVVLAGAARPLEDLVLEQTAYLLSLKKESSAEEKAALDAVRKAATRLKELKGQPEDPGEKSLLGQPLGYWVSARELKPTETAGKLKQRILVLQGERDYQVTMADFALWEKALAGRPGARLVKYPSLNHLFAEGEGKARPEEYFRPAPVAGAVVEEVAKWVKGG